MQEIKVPGIIQMSDVKKLDISKIVKFDSNIKPLDAALGGFRMGELTIFSGKRGEGKSTLASQLLIEAMDQGFNVCAYSGELRAEMYQYWAHNQMAGKENLKSHFDKTKQEEIYFTDDRTAFRIKEWYRNRYFLFDNDLKDMDAEQINILRTFYHAYETYGCRVFLIDNLLTVKSVARNITESDFYRAQSEFVANIIRFVNKTQSHVFLVAHPRKLPVNSGKTKQMEGDDVSGSGDIINLCHNMISIKRESGEDGFNATLDIKKNRFYGDMGSDLGLVYDKASKRYAHWMNPSLLYKKYGWENQNKENQVEMPF